MARRRLDWDELARRGGSPAQAAAQASTAPASFVAFDLLADGLVDTRPLPWVRRRALLEARSWQPPLQLCPHTLDHDEATAWFESPDLRLTGVEGLVVKDTTSPYRPGQRDWLKVKTRETVEVIVGAVTGTLERPTAVVAGRYTPVVRRPGPAGQPPPRSRGRLRSDLSPASTRAGSSFRLSVTPR